jgi:hypothetical protein
VKKPTSPLTKAEIREGLERLMASPLMTNAEGRKGDYLGAVDATSDARTDIGPRIRDLGLKRAGNVAGVIEDLGFALLAHRLTAEELFRLGTSAEAMQLFEETEERIARMKAFHAAPAKKAQGTEEAGA